MEWYNKRQEAFNAFIPIGYQHITAWPKMLTIDGESREVYSFTGHATAEDLEAYIKKLSPKDRVGHEVKLNYENSPFCDHLHLDIDFPIGEQDDDLFADTIDQITLIAKTVMIELFPDNFERVSAEGAEKFEEVCGRFADGDVYFADSSGYAEEGYKHSGHIIFKYYGKYEHERAFNEATKARAAELNQDIAEYIDTKITSSRCRMLRLPGCSKLSDVLAGTPRYKKYSKNFTNCILTVVPDWNDRYNVSSNYVQPYEDIKNYKINLIEDDKINNILTQAEIRGFKLGVGRTGNEIGNVVTRIEPARCPICERIHSRLGGAIIENFWQGRTVYKYICFANCADAKADPAIKVVPLELYSEEMPRVVPEAIDAAELYSTFYARAEDVRNPQINITIQSFYEMFDNDRTYSITDGINFLRQTLAIVNDGSPQKTVIAKVINFETLISDDKPSIIPVIGYKQDKLRAYKKGLLAEYRFNIIKDDKPEAVTMDNLIGCLEDKTMYKGIVSVPVGPAELGVMTDTKTFNTYLGPLAYTKRDLVANLSAEACGELIAPIRNHMSEVFCRNDQAEYKFLLSWLRHVFIRPAEKTNILPVFKGSPGCGKSVFWNFIGDYILGDSLYLKSNVENVIGVKFNALSAYRKLILCEEVGNHEVNNKLEALKEHITGTSTQIELKGVDAVKARDYVDYVFNTNNINAVRLDPGQRRFKIFDCDGKYSEAAIGKQASYEYFEMFHRDPALKAAAFYKWITESTDEELGTGNIKKLDIPYNDLMNRITEISNPPIVDFLLETYTECNRLNNFGNTSQKILYEEYKMWAAAEGMNKSMTAKNFKLAMEGLGFDCKQLMAKTGSKVLCFRLEKQLMIEKLSMYKKIEWFSESTDSSLSQDEF